MMQAPPRSEASLRPEGSSPLGAARPGHWNALLRLEFQRFGAETVLVGRHHQGPLRVQRPFRETSGACQAYILHPPGGVVGGDTLHVNVHAQRGANAVLTTPGATKFYRTSAAVARQSQLLRAEPDSSIEWLPQEAIVFNGANASSHTTIDLRAGARFIGWEITCLGRPACGETFDTGLWRQRLHLRQEGRPLLTEAIFCAGNDETLHAAWGFAGLPTYGTLVVHPAAEAALTIARQCVAEVLQHNPEDRFGASQLAQGEGQSTLVCRYLGPSAERCKHLFTLVWQALRPHVLGLEAEVPRVWST